MNTQSWYKPYFDRLSSMSLAIALLVVLAIASAIGTVLLQNQEQTDYLSQFGPLWYNVFVSLNLFDMYHTPWFFGLLGFLMVSVSVCLWRNVPHMLKEMRTRKVTIAEKSLKTFHHQKQWQIEEGDVAAVKSSINQTLRGWEKKEAEKDGALYIRGDKGRFHKWGYILVHSAILVILVGGWIGAHFGFRGTMEVVENSTGDTIDFLKGTSTGHLQMPFKIRCDKFFIDFYPTGMPKAFRSTLSIIDHGKVVINHKDIIVNKPLIYKGVHIFQASFGDGGSQIFLKLFDMNSGKVRDIKSHIYDTWNDPQTGVSLQFTNFREYNIENMADPGQPKHFQDLGPSVEYVIRGPNLTPVKVKCYMNPVYIKGEDRGQMLEISTTGRARDYQPFALGLDFTKPTDWKLYTAFIDALKERGGVHTKQANFAAFNEAIHKVFGDNRPAKFREMGMRMLQALDNLSRVPWPFVPILTNYNQVYYTGLELAHDPGMNTVWVGSALLVIGLCIMFYVPHRKLWVILKKKDEGVEVSLGAMTNRNVLSFEREFNELLTKLDEGLRPHIERRSVV